MGCKLPELLWSITMCGIAGLFLKDRTLEGDLGALLAGMLAPLSDRGPDSTGFDLCLVHNGSLSNHNAVRRELIREGLTFQTENDSEVAAGFITWQLHGGRSLEQAMAASLGALDGFYTFVIGAEQGFGVLRDPIACKPAVMAETERWVAFGTEYRALVDLPGIDGARVWEPAPAHVYRWELH